MWPALQDVAHADGVNWPSCKS